MCKIVHAWGSRNQRLLAKDCHVVWKVVRKKVLLRYYNYHVEKAGKSGSLATVGDLYSMLSLGARIILCIFSIGKIGGYILLRTLHKNTEF